MEEDISQLSKPKTFKSVNILYLSAFIAAVGLFLFIYFNYCSKDKTDSFKHFLKNNDAYLSETLPSGAYYIAVTLEQDKNSHYTVAGFFPSIGGDYNAWAALDREVQVADMKYFANAVIAYAKSENWDNDYYLYVTANCVPANFVYNYETNTFYYPKDLKLLNQMYEKFDTMYPLDLVGNEAGERFLIDNGMGNIKHGQFEVTYLGIYYNVFISDGEISEYGFNDSIAYK